MTSSIEDELERDPLVAVHVALADAFAGHPVDADRLRSLITATCDQADAHARNEAFSRRSRAGAARWARSYRRLLDAVDALELGDVHTAHAAVRSAMYEERA